MEAKVLKNADDIYLIELSGTMDLYSSNQLKELIMKMLNNKIQRFIISLKGVKIVNSAGIGALIYISSTLKKMNCPLVIIVPEGPVMNALELTRIKSYFAIASSLEEAISLTTK